MIDEQKSGPNSAGNLGDDDGIDLIYKIESEPGEVDVFELARVLDSFGNVLKESYRVAYPQQGELVVRVKPFEEGSFLMDLALTVQQNPALLFVLASPDAINNARSVLEFLGLIKDLKETSSSLLGLLRFLRNGKADSVDQKGPDHFEYHAADGSVMPVNSTVNALYNNPIINNYTFNIFAPVERESVESIKTYLKNDFEASGVRITKEDAEAVRAFAKPQEVEPKVEVLEATTTKVLNPMSGNYGQTTGTWNFRIAGTKRSIKARIADKNFLSKYSTGSIRFYRDDKLKVHLTERQIIEGSKTRMEYEISEVILYTPAHPVVQSAFSSTSSPH